MVIDNTARYGGSFRITTELLEGYDLHVVYDLNRGSEPNYTAWRISRTESCDSINEFVDFKHSGHWKFVRVAYFQAICRIAASTKRLKSLRTALA